MRSSLTPREIVAELDRYIVGQTNAKRAVAVALRNRWRRQQVTGELRDDITPKNIILIGPTGVGKTEIARRLAKLAGSPFVKVEASKFTEVGYVGRDVESMVRDLVEAAISLVRDEELERVRQRAIEGAEDRLSELLKNGSGSRGFGLSSASASSARLSDADREKFRAQLSAGTFDDQIVEVEVADTNLTFMRNFSGQGLEEMGVNLQDLFKGFPGQSRTRKRKAPAPEALKLLEAEESSKLIDQDRVTRDALKRAENDGIIFLDEIDKIANREGGKGGPDVSREGVQRDLLPIVEGSSVTTKYGTLKTDHVLFIAAGAFHVSKPSDLIPELQGRFPIRVELEPLSGQDLVRILREPKNSLLKQYTALLTVEGVTLTITDDAIEELARLAQLVNERSQNIGARRLHTVLERLLEDVSFSAGDGGQKQITVDVAFVREKLADLVKDEDLSRYILYMGTVMIEAKPASDTSSTAASTKTDRLVDSAKHHLLQNYKQQPVVLVKGAGPWVWDAEGKKYLDLIAGIATCALGHCHPVVVEAAKKQLETLWHASNVFYTEPQIQLAERLTAAFGGIDARAFFCNSGAEANEALIKLARRWQHEIAGNKERFEIITFEGGFHGRTLATVTATAQPRYHVGFEPLPKGFVYAPMGDLEAVRRLVGPQTAAIMIEPIQGEGGVRPAPAGFLAGLRALCDQHGLLLLIDEVQTGIGRTGKPFAYQHDGITPDAISLAKSLGNGLPIGAMLCSDAVGKALPSGTHGSTFGGNPVAAAAAVATWDLATSPQMLASNVEKGALLHRLGNELKARKPGRVVECRGRGLLFGIEVDTGAAEVVARCRQNGLLVNLAGEKTIRFAPAYVTTSHELTEGLTLFERSL